MSLEEEIVLYRFAQGVGSAAELLDSYVGRDEHEQGYLFSSLHRLVKQLAPTEADIEQVLADSSPAEADSVADLLKSFRSKTGLVPPPGNGFEPGSLVVLNLFRTVYQRRFLAEKDNTVNWHYRDLSNPQVVLSILAEHRALAEKVYAHPSFRGEFASMAKLWFAQVEQRHYQAPPPGRENQFDFVTYDEIANTSVVVRNTKRAWDIRFLQRALANALSIQYGLTIEQAERVVADVMERHLRETFNVDRCGRPVDSAS